MQIHALEVPDFEESLVHWTVYGVLEGDQPIELAYSEALQFLENLFSVSIVCPLDAELRKIIQERAAEST